MQRSASSDEPSTSASLTGLVIRLAPSSDLSQELKAAPTTLEKITTYARHGIWYETLTQLAQMRLNEPQNSQLQQTWIELLSDQTIGLEQKTEVGRMLFTPTHTTHFPSVSFINDATASLGCFQETQTDN